MRVPHEWLYIASHYANAYFCKYISTPMQVYMECIQLWLQCKRFMVIWVTMIDVQLNGTTSSQALCKEQQILTTASKTTPSFSFCENITFSKTPVADIWKCCLVIPMNLSTWILTLASLQVASMLTSLGPSWLQPPVQGMLVCPGLLHRGQHYQLHQILYLQEPHLLGEDASSTLSSQQCTYQRSLPHPPPIRDKTNKFLRCDTDQIFGCVIVLVLWPCTVLGKQIWGPLNKYFEAVNNRCNFQTIITTKAERHCSLCIKITIWSFD